MKHDHLEQHRVTHREGVVAKHAEHAGEVRDGAVAVDKARPKAARVAVGEHVANTT